MGLADIGLGLGGAWGGAWGGGLVAAGPRALTVAAPPRARRARCLLRFNVTAAHGSCLATSPFAEGARRLRSMQRLVFHDTKVVPACLHDGLLVHRVRVVEVIVLDVLELLGGEAAVEAVLGDEHDAPLLELVHNHVADGGFP